MRLAGLSVLLVLPLFSAPPASACSKGTFPTVVRDSVAFFIGSATPDTLLAGPGTVEYGTGGGHYGRGDDRVIYGQLVRVERLGGPATEQLSVNVQEVVVVPWDYDPACHPLAWGESAQWVPPGTRGFYVAKLRAPEHWAGGRPTFDLHNPGHLPYTATTHIREMGRDAAIASLLSPSQVFDFYRALPAAAGIAREKTQALGALRDWVRAHPDLAERPPVERLLDEVLWTVAQEELKATDHPALGTWRFSLWVSEDSSYTFYARTTSRPTERWTPSGRDAGSGEGLLAPAEGYTFTVAVGRRLEDLPEVAQNRRDFAFGFFSALAEADSIRAGKVFRRGWIGSELIRRAAPADPRVHRAASEVFEDYLRRSRQGLPLATSAQFIGGADGKLRVRQALVLSSGEELILEGAMVSSEVVATPW